MNIFMKISWAVLPLGIMLLGSCGSSESKDEAQTGGKFVLSKQMIDSITKDTVRYAQVQGELTLNGKVTADENKVLEVYPTLSGYATQITVQLGDFVQKGQLLAVVHSGEIATYQNQLSDASSNLAVARKNLQVKEDLYKSKLATQQDILDANSEVTKAKAAIDQLNDLFRIYKKGSGATYQIVAPISGYIIQKNINNGMEIRSDNNQSLFTISEINDVWVIANVFETDIPKVKEGYDADITSISYPNQVFHGKIDKLYNFLDPTTKTMQARIKINNNNGLLKPEMFASVKIHYPGTDSLLEIPSSAIIFDNNSNYVLVMTPKNDLSIQEVRPASTNGDVTYIKRGVKEGQVIITKNQLLLYNALLQ